MSLPLDYQLDHLYGGNGFALIRELDDGFSEVVQLQFSGIYPSHRNIVVATKMLSVSMRAKEKDGPVEPVPIAENKDLNARRILTNELPPQESWTLKKQRKE